MIHSEHLLDLLQESVIVCAEDGCIVAWNAASTRIYGWEIQSANGRKIHDLLKTRRESLPAIEAAIEESGTWEGDVERRDVNGNRIIVKLRCVRRTSGDITEIIETAVDVTAHRGAEESLSRAEHRYYNVFRAMAVSFWELDFTAVGAMVQRLLRAGVDLERHFEAHPEFVSEMIRATRVIDVNDQSVAMFGGGNKQEMLAGLEPYWPPASQSVYAMSVIAAVQGRPQYAAETRLSSIDGRVIDVWFTACFPPEMLARGKLLIGIIDISADKKAKLAVQASEERYRTLFNFLPVALVQLDRAEMVAAFDDLHAKGVEDLQKYFDHHPEFYDFATESIKVAEANQRALELFAARTKSELLGPAKLLWSEARTVIQRSMAARFSGASQFEAEMKIRTLDGRIRDVFYVAYFPEAFRQKALGLACFVDISERVRAQTMLAQLQSEFAHAARVSMLGELTASIAHEINQPLAAILTNGEAALRWLDRPEPDLSEVKALSIRTIADAGRAADIIRRIRLMAARGVSEHAYLTVNSVIEDVMLFLQPELIRQDVRATLELSPELPAVLADRVQLQQVFANLAMNAMQAMQAMARTTDRQLIVRTRLMDSQSICAEVEDTGPGLAPDLTHRLFESFFTTKSDGMGIGLAICRSIIEAHGGRIEAMNREDGHGARFRFSLPIAAPLTAGQSAVSAAASHDKA
jgi:PAS domain S-box-containing protein